MIASHARLALLVSLAAALAVPAAGLAVGGSAPPGNGSVRSITVATSGRYQAIDATPNPAGTRIFFTAKGTGRVGVYRVDSGGRTTSIATDAPFAAPRGLVSSRTGSTLYVADPSAAGGGAIFSVPAVPGGRPTMVQGTQGTHPRALDALSVGGSDRLFYAGIDPNDHKPAILTVDSRGGNVAIVAKGAPLVAPDGVAVADSRTLYVSDSHGSVFKVGATSVVKIAGGIHTGTPAGIALTRDGKTLYVSTLVGGKARILLLDLASGQKGLVSKVIGSNAGAGGLHRARAAKVFASAGKKPGGVGVIYRLVPS
jgi:sugar lactone lactonase YvrE